MTYEHIGAIPFIALAIGSILATLIPLGLAIFWTVKKKENFGVIVAGAAAFFLFAIVIEKIIQNVLIFPTSLGLKDNAVSLFVGARPILLSFIAALFPGVFEETGRLITYKTVLKKHKNRETSISYGIGHGGFEVMFLLGSTYTTYIYYAFLINTDSFGKIVDQVMEQAPSQLGTLEALVTAISAFSFADLGVAVIERVFAVLFHVGASIIVFYACKDRKKFWLYPLAIALHTAMDFVAALYLFEVIHISAFTLELIIAVFGILVFFGAYLLLYKKDVAESPAAPSTENING